MRGSGSGMDAQLVKVVTIFLAVSCLVSFWWGRRSFFVRESGNSRARRGLAPLGWFFAVGSIVALSRGDPAGRSLYWYVAMLLMLGAVALFWSSVRSFRGRRPSIAFTAGAPEELVTSGPYQYIRHPFYTSYSMYWLSTLVACPNILTATSVVTMGALYLAAARTEESELLASSVGARYQSYRAATGMFFPRMKSRQVDY